MELKDFTSLKEIQSLDRMIKKHLDVIDSEQSRKDHIKGLREKRETEKLGLFHKVRENTALISELEVKLSKLEEKKESQIMVEEIEKISYEMDSTSEEIFSLMENNEELEKNISDCKTFLSGSLETLAEIDEEIKEETKDEQKEIDNYNKRIDALLEQIPQELKNAFIKARKKYPQNVYLSRIVDRACEKCRFQLDSQSISLIDQARLVQECHQCGRLLIPFDS
ncbi:MAG: hypothetical protein NXH75_08125 [Halobacteriovoraceae bacterium]|nr:hypothetical protein [Halobacteriovoraceae bacterium]